MEEIKFNYKIDSNELTNVSLYNIKKLKVLYIIPIALIIFFMMSIFGDLLFSIIIPEHTYQEKDWTEYIPAFIFPIILIIVAFRLKNSIKKNIDKNPRIKEVVNYTVNQSFIEEKGESFSVKHYWNNLNKIEETDKWFLIFVNRHQSLPIFKNQINSETIDQLRLIFNGIDIKKKLKN